MVEGACDTTTEWTELRGEVGAVAAADKATVVDAIFDEERAGGDEERCCCKRATTCWQWL